MKKTFVYAAVLGVLLTAGPIAFAQQAASKQQNQEQQKKIDPKKLQELIASERMNELDQLFALTPEQKKKIDPIVQEEAQKLTKIQMDKSIKRTDKSTDKRTDKYRQKKAITSETMTKVKQFLTPDQLKKIEYRKGVRPEIQR